VTSALRIAVPKESFVSFRSTSRTAIFRPSARTTSALSPMLRSRVRIETVRVGAGAWAKSGAANRRETSVAWKGLLMDVTR
jgi:hypothetical protein